MIKKGEKCPTCGRHVARDIVCSGIVVKDNKVLLIIRGINPEIGKWALPGGYLSWNETAEEAVVREVKEETGIDTKVKRLSSVNTDPHRIPSEDLQNVGLFYELEPLSFELSKQDKEVEDVKWIDLDDIPLDLAFDHNNVLEDFNKRQKPSS